MYSLPQPLVFQAKYVSGKESISQAKLLGSVERFRHATHHTSFGAHDVCVCMCTHTCTHACVHASAPAPGLHSGQETAQVWLMSGEANSRSRSAQRCLRCMAETQRSWQKHSALAGNLSRAACFRSSNTGSFHQEQQKMGEMCLIASGLCVSTFQRQRQLDSSFEEKAVILLFWPTVSAKETVGRNLPETQLPSSYLGSHPRGSVIEKQKVMTALTLCLLIMELPGTREEGLPRNQKVTWPLMCPLQDHPPLGSFLSVSLLLPPPRKGQERTPGINQYGWHLRGSSQRKNSERRETISGSGT